MADRHEVTAPGAWRWMIGSLAWTALVSVALMVVPTSTSSVETADGEEFATGHETLLQSEGISVLPVLMVPVLLPVLALVAGPRRRGVVLGLGVVYLVLALLGAASIGLFYVPGAGALVMAGSLAVSASTVRS